MAKTRVVKAWGLKRGEKVLEYSYRTRKEATNDCWFNNRVIRVELREVKQNAKR